MSESNGEVQTQKIEGSNQAENVESRIAELEAMLAKEKSSKDRILEESKKYKEGYQTFKQERDEVARMKAQAEEEKLREKGQYDVLLKQREERLKELENQLLAKDSEIGDYKGAMDNFKKAAAFERQLGGKLKKDSYWDHVDFDSIALNPETNAIDQHSLTKVANAFADEYKELIDYGKVGNLPNSAASRAGSLTYEQWKMLPLKEQQSRMKDVRR